MREEFQKIINLIKIANGVDGRKKIQKMVYILKQKGMGFKEPFKYHHFGPYSSQLQIELNALVEWKIIEETKSDNSYCYTISEDQSYDEQQYNDDEDYRNLIKYLKTQSPSILELVSTFYFLKNKGYDSFGAIKQKTLYLKPHIENVMENAVSVYDHIESQYIT